MAGVERSGDADREVKCPVCGLLNPPEAEQRDCGYNFSARSGGTKKPFVARYRMAMLLAILVVILMLAYAVWSFFQVFNHSPM